MKKKIAVLMAAATAVTTVAPVVANADTTTYSNQSLQALVDAAKKALEAKYANNGDGLDALDLKTDSSSLKDWQKSRYAVLLKVEKTDVPAIPANGDLFEAYNDGTKKESESKQEPSTYNVKNLPVKDINASEENTAVYIVKDIDGLYNYLEKMSITEGATISLYVVDKGATSDNKSYRESEGKVIEPDFNGGTTGGTRDNTVTLLDQLNALVYDYEGGSNANNNPIVKKIVTKVVAGSKTYTLKENKVNDGTGNVTSKIENTDATKLEVYLAGGTKFTLENSDDALNFAKPINKDGEIKDSDANDVSVLNSITGFAVLDRDDKDNTDKVKADIKTGDTVVYKLNPTLEKNYTLPTFYTGANGFTEAGADFANNFRQFNSTTGKALNLDGTSYKFDEIAAFTSQTNPKPYTITKDKDGKYLLQFVVKVKDANDTQKKTTLQLNFTSDVQKDLTEFADELLKTYTDATRTVAGKFNRLAGTDRYQTAIEISKEAFDGKTAGSYADTVVITGGTALLDGLSAAPLASANNATLLLASPKSGLSQATIDEIGRATDNKLYKKTVYIVGGYNSVPASVDKVLQDKFGAVVIRLAGDDRYATSKQVAERLVYDGKENGNIFYVGGNGAADAMSVAPVAATYKIESNKRKVAPILVVRDKALDQQTRNFLMKKVIKSDGTRTEEQGKSYVIGGLNSLGTDFSKDATAVAAKTVEENPANAKPIIERLSGDDRYATNVKVLNEFYTVGTVDTNKIIKTEGLFVASGITNYLVDAQTAGSFAATKKAPILLAGSKLTDAQIDLLKKPAKAIENATPFYTTTLALGDNIASNVYQIGGVVSADAMKVVVDKFDL